MDLNPEAHIGRFRRREMSLMRSTCTITRGDGSEVWDPATGTYVPGTTTVYSGPCRLWYPSRAAGDVEGGASTFAISDYIVTLPIDTDVTIDDVIVVTSGHDPAASPVTLVVERVPKSDWQIARKAECREYRPEPT